MGNPEARATGAAGSKANRRKAIHATIEPEDRVSLYAVQRHLAQNVKRQCGLQIPIITYFQDPLYAKVNPKLAFDEEVFVNWEAGLADGPTSARFAVVDFNGDSGKLAAPAEWDEAQQKFVSGGKLLDKSAVRSLQFHQVSVWALLQRALAFFEDGNGLGRRVPWAFEGNRLIVVPHAGYGENAFYDRVSKSLQFYYFGSETDPVYTCLSADIVNHEFAHAVLDGVRPLYNESTSVQTAAFHEFMGDLTAILLTLRNNKFRQHQADQTKGKMENAKDVSAIAEQFGKEVSSRPYLRTAQNNDTLPKLKDETSPHRVSEVLTGAMFDVLKHLAARYQTEPEDLPTESSGLASPKPRTASPKQAFWWAAERMQRMAIQPLDLLPPVEVTFRDYALAVSRAEQLSDPVDPQGYHHMLIDVFRKRGILTANDERELKRPRYLHDRLRLSVPHEIKELSRSRAAAYRFLDDNREDLLIPANRDFFVSDLYDANKLGRQAARMPRQIIVEYVWREEVLLNGSRFGPFKDQTTTMLCGGTLAFDDDGTILSWVIKPGSLPYGGKRSRGGAVARAWESAVNAGTERRKALLKNLAAAIAAGRIGSVIGTEKGLLGTHVPPVLAESQDDRVQFRLSPHLHLSEDQQLDDEEARLCQISC